MIRRRYQIQGLVQGVGFRPFCVRLAQEFSLVGQVQNGPQGVWLEWQGLPQQLEQAEAALQQRLPLHARITHWTKEEIPPQPVADFQILPSLQEGERSPLLLPDLATCPECLAEIFDPHNRRYGYPFTNCTQCGPRYSIIKSLPYDRQHTSMRGFAQCPDCLAEYQNPQHRRFHAQPNACPNCGPRLILRDGAGHSLAEGPQALAQALASLRNGKVLAIKGIGGFHLMGRAWPSVIEKIRQIKHRPRQSLALMVPDVEVAHQLALLSPEMEAALTSSSAPIVLCPSQPHSKLQDSLAPGLGRLGLMLPYSPLHHLLCRGLGEPLVATSANFSGEPLAIHFRELLEPLALGMDAILDHDRPIVRPVDDSLVQIVGGQPQVLRRARGLAPLPVTLPEALEPCLALGGDQKNAIALASGTQIFVSPHLGDLKSPRSLANQFTVMSDFQDLLGIEPQALVGDLHPGYASARLLANSSLPKARLQHHQAHLWALQAEVGTPTQALGLSWDGTGLGSDGTLWGGEAFLWQGRGWEPLAGLRPFALIGGEEAIRDPRRSAWALTRHLGIAPAALGIRPEEAKIWGQMLEKKLNCPLTSSMGRLFDGVAAWLNLCRSASYEGQPAMELEAMADPKEQGCYPFSTTIPFNWEPMLRAIAKELEEKVPLGVISARFHQTLAVFARDLALAHGAKQVYASGGCFQNLQLLARLQSLLDEVQIEFQYPRQFPPNDGGLALGQIWGNHWEKKHVSGRPGKSD